MIKDNGNMVDVIVIGGGPAGVTAALRARELGASVTLVERGEMGGTCTNDGCAPTRVLAKTARLLRDAHKFNEYGLEGARPTLNWERLLARTHAVVNALHEKKQLLGHLEASGVKVYHGVGSAQFLDPHTLALGSFAPGNGSLIIKSSGANGEMRLQADKFILAAGGHARRLPFPGSELALTHSDVWTMRRLPRSVAIVGAAATGCQLASVLNEFGSQVTLLDIAPRIVPVEDELVSRTLQERFEARGIRVITGMQSITRLDRNGRGLQFAFQQAGQEQVLNVEAVIVAVGWVGNLEPLNLDAAGVQAQRGFVLVNDALQTSASHIFAAGDITGRMMLVQSATVEGIVAAENAVAGAQQTFAHNIVPHGGFTDPEYGSVGLTEAQAHTRGDSVVATVSYSEIDRAVIDDQTIGFCKLIVGRERHFIWGAHVVGEQALEVTQMVAAAMAANAQIGDLARLEIAYPTYAAIVGLAARRVVQALGVQATDASWQTLGNAAGAEWERGAG